MTTSVQLFNFQQHPVRVTIIENEPWWVASDVCKILDISNVHQAVSRLEKDGVCLTYTVDPKGRRQEVTAINEPNLYRLIFRSDKAEAKAFQDWVFGEVLPTIRKTGKYEVPTPEQIFTKAVQDRCIRNEKLLKPGVFCVVTEMYREAWTLEAFQKELQPSCLPDGSCGTAWRKYLVREQHPLLDKSYQVHLHVPNRHDLVKVWVYPLELLIVFRSWLRAEYAQYYTVSYAPSRLTSEARAIAGPRT